MKSKLDQYVVVAVWLTLGKHMLTLCGIVSDANLPVAGTWTRR